MFVVCRPGQQSKTPRRAACEHRSVLLFLHARPARSKATLRGVAFVRVRGGRAALTSEAARAASGRGWKGNKASRKARRATQSVRGQTDFGGEPGSGGTTAAFAALVTLLAGEPGISHQREARLRADVSLPDSARARTVRVTRRVDCSATFERETTPDARAL